jgi:hypothetical protein
MGSSGFIPLELTLNKEKRISSLTPKNVITQKGTVVFLCNKFN